MLDFERLASHMRLVSKFRVRSAAPFVSPFCSTACIRFISSLQDVHTVSVCLTSSPRSNANLLFYLDCDVYFNIEITIGYQWIETEPFIIVNSRHRRDAILQGEYSVDAASWRLGWIS